jgi:hypothetical protein
VKSTMARPGDRRGSRRLQAPEFTQVGIGRRGIFAGKPRGMAGNGDPGLIRTADTQFRKLLLYPSELRGHIFFHYRSSFRKLLVRMWCVLRAHATDHHGGIPGGGSSRLSPVFPTFSFARLLWCEHVFKLSLSRALIALERSDLQVS